MDPGDQQPTHSTSCILLFCPPPTNGTTIVLGKQMKLGCCPAWFERLLVTWPAAMRLSMLNGDTYCPFLVMNFGVH